MVYSASSQIDRTGGIFAVCTRSPRYSLYKKTQFLPIKENQMFLRGTNMALYSSSLHFEKIIIAIISALYAQGTVL